MSEAMLDTPLRRPEIRALYARLAGSYDLWAGLTDAKAHQAALARAAVAGGEAVLEVAVGTGLLFEELLRANPGGRNVGIDLTEAMLERARKRARKVAPGGNWELAVGDACALTFPDASFDLVLCGYLFDLLPEADFGVVVGEMTRVLRPGGRLVLVNLTHGGGWTARAAAALFKWRPALMGGCRAVALEPWLRAAGLVDVRREVVTQMGVASEVLSAVRPREGIK